MRAIAVSMGDPCGIGAQIALKSWQRRNEISVPFVIFGSENAFNVTKQALNIQAPITIVKNIKEGCDAFQSALPIIEISDSSSNISLGMPNKANADAIIKSIELAHSAVVNNDAIAMVTLPIAKAPLYDAGFDFKGHTEFLGELCRPILNTPHPIPIMMLAIEGLRVALVTIHEAIIDVPKLITKEKIIETAQIINAALKNDFGIKNPKIGLLALNPHAGEDGAMGREEIEIINPTAQILRQMGVNISNALPADSAFSIDNRKQYDAFIAMYHDQGLIPIKALDFWGGVNITLGLPIVRTSPDHGTGFGIANQNIANPDSFINAIKSAINIADNRASA